MSVNKSNQKSSSSQALTPNNDALLGNAAQSDAVTSAPVTPYSGPLGVSADTSASQGTLSGLMGYNAPTVSTAQNVSTDQINHYMDPYLNDVVGATNNDINHQRAVAMAGVKFDPAWGGGTRDAIYKATVGDNFDRTLASTDAGLRSQGFQSAVGYGQQDLSRILGADTANQGASLASAGVRSGAATGLAGILGQQATLQQANQAATYQEFLRQQQDALMKQQLRNQTYGLLYNGPLTQASSSGSTYGFSTGQAPAGAPVPA